jgi:hypothetical protein
VAFGIDREKLTSPLCMLALTGVAFGSMSVVVLRDGGDGGRPPAMAPATTIAAPAAVEVGAPTTTPADTTAPPLTIDDRFSNATVDTATVTLEGTSEPGARVAVGFASAITDALGTWQIPISLSEGSNTLTLAATDDAGNQTLAVLVLTYAPPAPTTLPPPPTDPPTTEAPTTAPPATEAPTTTARRRSTTDTTAASHATAPPTTPPATAPPVTAPPTTPPTTIPRDVEDGSD